MTSARLDVGSTNRPGDDVTPRAAYAAAALAAAVLVGCSTGGTEKTKLENPRAVLAQAKTILDSATSVQVVITSVGVPPGVSALVGDEGVAARPASFEGDLEVSVGGGVMTVEVPMFWPT
jgi:hypothetical protein